MQTASNVAAFVARRIQELGCLQREVAEAVGYDNPNIITMIKQGKTKLPLSKVSLMAHALETDPLHLLHLCMSEYFPETWEVIAPMMSGAITLDEHKLLRSLRSIAGGPYIAGIDEESKARLQAFLDHLRAQVPSVQ